MQNVIFHNFNQNWKVSKIFVKITNTEFHDNTTDGSRVVPGRRTDGQTKTQDDTFSPFAKFFY